MSRQKLQELLKTHKPLTAYCQKECYACGSSKTKIGYKGKEQWNYNKPTNLVLCNICIRSIYTTFNRSLKFDRVCYACNSTHSDERWVLNKGTNLELCYSCAYGLDLFYTRVTKSLPKEQYICYACGTDQPYKSQKGKHAWIVNRDINNIPLHVMCNTCFAKIIQQYIPHKLYNRKFLKESRTILRDILGGQFCIKCGFSDIRALHFDHINGGGQRYNMQRWGQRKLAVKTINYLIKHPKEAKATFQVLCANCNAIKAVENNENQIKDLPIFFKNT